MWEGKWCSRILYREHCLLEWPVLTWGKMGRKNYQQRKLRKEAACPNFASRDLVQNIWAKFAQNRRRDSASFTGHKIEISRVGGWERYGFPRVRVSNKFHEFFVECKAQRTIILSEIFPHACIFKLRQQLKVVVLITCKSVFVTLMHPLTILGEKPLSLTRADVCGFLRGGGRRKRGSNRIHVSIVGVESSWLKAKVQDL